MSEEQKPEMITKHIIKEGDDYFDLINNYISANENDTIKPETFIKIALDETIEKIKSLHGAKSLIKDEKTLSVITSKIEAYEDSSRVLIQISSFIEGFSKKKEDKNE